MSILYAVILEDSSGGFGIRYSAMGKTILRTNWIGTSVDALPLARNPDVLRESYSPMLTSASRRLLSRRPQMDSSMMVAPSRSP